jgi:DNA-binding CsgD family transcriptional regulator
MTSPRLLGRRTECEALDRFLLDVRGGQSRVLVLCGEAGVGKSVLLKYLVTRASGFRVARAAGVESEMELPFSGLHQLCALCLDRLEALPEPQRDALGTAFGVLGREAPDRFLVGLAVLGLLSDLAEEQPLLWVVDDAQWLDRASSQVLAFVARRLEAESVGLVFAAREADDGQDLTGLPELVLQGLGEEDARALLESVVPGLLDEPVRDRIVAETRGNPLALLELPRGMTPAELAGGFAMPHTLPIASQIEQGFVRRLRPLPAETQRLLLVAASEPVGDVPLLWRAADRLGIGPEAAVPAEAAGLIEIGGRVRFRHPLVRSACRRLAGVADLQEAHRGLAEATDPELDPDRRAWHLASAAVGPDEAVAGELERSADRAQARGGIAAAAAFLERATALTPDPSRRGARALAAAQAKLDAGAPEAALELLATAELCPLDSLQRARLERLRAMIAFAGSRGGDAPRLLFEAATRLEPLDAKLARETYLEALGAAVYAGRLGDPEVIRRMAEAARAASGDAEPQTALDLLRHGLATWFADGHAAAVPPLRRALRALAQREPEYPENLRWLGIASPVAFELWDQEEWHRMATPALRAARDAGAFGVLPTALIYRSGVAVNAGRFAEAEALLAEAEAISGTAGTPRATFTALFLASWRGDEAVALPLIEDAIRDATDRGEGRTISLAEYGRTILYIGLGRYDDAFAAATRACEHEDLGVFASGLSELVEAGIRSGKRAVAGDALRQLEERTSGAGTPWARGIEARSRALVSDGPDAEALYREAIERLPHDSDTELQLARTQLMYGEWLRREGRRVDAREQLRPAHEFFDRVGAAGFAERARRELLATGETARKRTPETRDDLTAQEAQIAQLARAGLTNPEIGTELFISPRTVEWHLRKVFAKLDISSRRELRRALPDASRPPVTT